MNYYNPYSAIPGYSIAPASRGLLGGLASRGAGISWGTILNNVQRALGIANQAIPVIKQVTPVMKNAKTMFQIMNEFKKVDTPTTTTTNKQETIATNEKTTPATTTLEKKNTNESGPVFFI